MQTTHASILSTPGDRQLHIERTFDAPLACVWRAYTEPDLLRRWWARGNPMDIEAFEFAVGGHWRFVERHAEGADGFEGRFSEIEPRARIGQTFEWDGMPGHPSLQTATFVPLGEQETKVVIDVLFFTAEERDGMVQSGMQEGMDQGYAALDALLAELCR